MGLCNAPSKLGKDSRKFRERDGEIDKSLRETQVLGSVSLGLPVLLRSLPFAGDGEPATGGDGR